MLVTVASASLLGAQGHPVTVEVHLSPTGLPGFTVVGRPDAVCRETRDRFRAAVLSAGLVWPRSRLTVNLTPSHRPKAGAALDLAVALGVLAADGQLDPLALDETGAIGELGLDGTLRPTRGALALAEAIDTPALVVPPANVAEARTAGRRGVRTAATLAELVRYLRHEQPWPANPTTATAPEAPPPSAGLADLRADPLVSLAVDVAAAGGHHLIMTGPHDAPTALVARRVTDLAPPLDQAQAIAVARVRSAAGLGMPVTGLDLRRPLRAPNHATTPTMVIGGDGPTLAPGDLTLAHLGTLFLDELDWFPASILDAVAYALDHATIRVTRAGTTVELPAQFQLIAAMAPCPCGRPDTCTCSPAALARHHRSIPARLLDRFDLRIALRSPAPRPAPPLTVPAPRPPGRVTEARLRLHARGLTATHATAETLAAHAPLDPDAARLLDAHHRAGTLSARGRSRVHAVACTIAALAGHHGPLDQPTVALALHLHDTAPAGPAELPTGEPT